MGFFSYTCPGTGSWLAVSLFFLVLPRSLPTSLCTGYTTISESSAIFAPIPSSHDTHWRGLFTFLVLHFIFMFILFLIQNYYSPDLPKRIQPQDLSDSVNTLDVTNICSGLCCCWGVGILRLFESRSLTYYVMYNIMYYNGVLGSTVLLFLMC